MIDVRTLDHVNILTGDVDRTTAFMTSVLGLEDGPRPPFGTPGHWLYRNGTAVVHVSDVRNKEIPTPSTHRAATLQRAARAESSITSRFAAAAIARRWIGCARSASRSTKGPYRVPATGKCSSTAPTTLRSS
jgi:catechol 2,3-dioxygenase-like lactoylglutathione lyase family enzyme